MVGCFVVGVVGRFCSDVVWWFGLVGLCCKVELVFVRCVVVWLLVVVIVRFVVC